MADQRKAELIAQLNRARSQAAANSRALGDDLQVGDKLKENIEANRGAWLAGAALTGLVISKLPPRTKKVVVTPHGHKVEEEIEKATKAGLLLSVVKMIFNFIKPFALKWVTKRLTQTAYLRPGAPPRPRR